ncbi:hypothetical protein C8F04DRAFT_1067659 [Mycena alexandri]|uniref:Uncharacterized protein n=1 Tax=Mycena alexandri TaxID=1745969 RepID=A0AAD6TGV2_9AGAR|nr:hypothetical protein C8F04DRAFT_1067659 [Mycena alexandri]
MTETILYLFLFLTFSQRSASLSWSAVDPSDTDVLSEISPSATSSANYGSNIATDAQSFSTIPILPPISAPILFPSTTLDNMTTFSITQTFTPESTTVIYAPSTPVSSASTASSASVGTVTSLSATSTAGWGIPPITVTGTTTFPGPISTSTFANAVHVSNPPPSASLSSSTIIFTTVSLSSFTSNGQIHTTAIPITSTSVTAVPVPVPTHSPAVNAAKSKIQLSTSVVVGIAIGAVAIFLVLVLCYIINRRRHLRKRAFLRLGEEI